MLTKDSSSKGPSHDISVSSTGIAGPDGSRPFPRSRSLRMLSQVTCVFSDEHDCYHRDVVAEIEKYLYLRHGTRQSVSAAMEDCQKRRVAGERSDEGRQACDRDNDGVPYVSWRSAEFWAVLDSAPKSAKSLKAPPHLASLHSPPTMLRLAWRQRHEPRARGRKAYAVHSQTLV